MSQAVWIEVEEDVAAAARHFRESGKIFAEGGLEGDDFPAYRSRMALLHAMQSGHTSIEAALVRILTLIDEDVPSGPEWHATLIRRASRPIAGRPAILSGALAVAVNETRRFRHVAMRSYDSFESDRAIPAIAAAALIAETLVGAIAAFRAIIDP